MRTGHLLVRPGIALPRRTRDCPKGSPTDRGDDLAPCHRSAIDRDEKRLSRSFADSAQRRSDDMEAPRPQIPKLTARDREIRLPAAGLRVEMWVASLNPL